MVRNIVAASLLTVQVQKDKEKQRGGGGEAGFINALGEKDEENNTEEWVK